MRLQELQPKWTAVEGRHGQGITFLCPHCKGMHISVSFINPLDGGLAEPDHRHYWQRIGQNLETLTIAPSIDASALGHWHGFILGGEVR